MTDASTASALLDAAEAEFAHAGIEDASLRAIMRAADADPGAIHYHFRTREALAEAVLDRVLRPLNARRLALLAEAEADCSPGDPVPLERLVEGLIRPDIEAAVELQARSEGRARLIGAIYIRPADFVEARVEDHFRPVAAGYLPHLCAALPELAADVLSWRVRWCLFGVLGALLSDASAPFAKKPDALVRDLTAASAAAIAAPHREQPTGQSRCVFDNGLGRRG
ncbi:MAG: TetR family transcriptional regulator, partial [Gaiellaceae bacterium]